MTDRITWNQLHMNDAINTGTRSRCCRRQVGAVIVSADNRQKVVGYNGPPRGYPSESDNCRDFCQRAKDGPSQWGYDNCVSVHAEANALLTASPEVCDGGTMYVSTPPCLTCAKMIANSGITTLHNRSDHFNDDRQQDFLHGFFFLRRCGIEIHVWVDDDVSD